MRILFLTSLVGVLAAGAAAVAQPAGQSGFHNPATLCLDGLGVNHPPLCHSQQASAFPQPPDICQCLGPYRQVNAAWCAPGQKPPADTIDFDRALIAYAQSHNNDVSDFSFDGKPMCVPLRPR
jgi:hypothetical protein